MFGYVKLSQTEDQALLHMRRERDFRSMLEHDVHVYGQDNTQARLGYLCRIQQSKCFVVFGCVGSC